MSNIPVTKAAVTEFISFLSPIDSAKLLKVPIVLNTKLTGKIYSNPKTVYAENALLFWLQIFGNYKNTNNIQYYLTGLTQTSTTIFDCIKTILTNAPTPLNLAPIINTNSNENPINIDSVYAEMQNVIAQGNSKLRINPLLHIKYVIYVLLSTVLTPEVYDLNAEFYSTFKRMYINLSTNIDPTSLNFVAMVDANLDPTNGPYTYQAIQQLYEAVFFNRNVIYDATAPGAYQPIPVANIEEPFKTIFTIKTGYVIRRLVILSFLYYYYHSVKPLLTGVNANSVLTKTMQAYYSTIINDVFPEFKTITIVDASGKKITVTYDTLGFIFNSVPTFTPRTTISIGKNLTFALPKSSSIYVFATYGYTNRLTGNLPMYDAKANSNTNFTYIFSNYFNDPDRYSITNYGVLEATKSNTAYNIAKIILQRLGLYILDVKVILNQGGPGRVINGGSSSDPFDYGPAYGFIPEGFWIDQTDPENVRWIQNVLAFINSDILGPDNDVTAVMMNNPAILFFYINLSQYIDVVTGHNTELLQKATVNGQPLIDYLKNSVGTGNEYIDEFVPVIPSIDLTITLSRDIRLDLLYAIGRYVTRHTKKYSKVKLVLPKYKDLTTLTSQRIIDLIGFYNQF